MLCLTTGCLVPPTPEPPSRSRSVQSAAPVAAEPAPEAAPTSDRLPTPSDPTSTEPVRGYQSRVHSGNQRLLAPDRAQFAKYLVQIHNRIHPFFAEAFLSRLDALPSSDPLNDPKLAVRIEIAISGVDGRIVAMGVVSSSHLASFDAGALEAFERAAPFEPPPAAILSSDGNCYFHWEFHRDPIFACSTINARPYRLALEPPR